MVTMVPRVRLVSLVPEEQRVLLETRVLWENKDSQVVKEQLEIQDPMERLAHLD